jgi:membrane protein
MLALAFGIAKGFDLQEKLQDILIEKLANQREVLNWICHFAVTTLREAQGGVIAGVRRWWC